MSNLVTCTTCGWVHARIEREDAQRAVDEFNTYAKTLDHQTFMDFYGGRQASIAGYESCFRCDSKEPMRAFRPGDCPDGVTIQATVLGPNT